MHVALVKPKFNPINIPTLRGWWSPDKIGYPWTEGSAITGELDLTSRGQFMNNSGGTFPAYRSSDSTLGYKPTLTFNGTNQHIFATLLATLSQPNEVFIVARKDALTENTGKSIMDGSTGARHAMLTLTTASPDSWWIFAGSGTVAGGAADTNPHVFHGVFNTTSSVLNIDGTQIAAGSAGTNALSAPIFGAAVGGIAGFFWNGVISEILLYNRLLSDVERSDINNYLKSKYKTP